MRHALQIPALCLLAGPAVAQTLDCQNAVSQVEMTGCAAQAYEAADAELNLAWKFAMAQARRMDDGMEWEPSNAEMLRDAQRSWIPFRDKACAAESSLMRGGSAQNMLFYYCLERLTRERTEHLRAFAEPN